MRKILIITAVLFFTCILFSFVHATEIGTNVTVDYDPIVTTISLTDSDAGTLQIYANDTRFFNCTGTVYDGDGFADIGTVNATIWGYNSTYAAADSAGVHYSNSSCPEYAGSGNTSTYACLFYVHHNTQNGTWTCNVTANDTYARTATNQTTNTVDVFKSISVPLQTIAFGAYAKGQNSGTTDKTVTVNNTGNINFSITVDAYSQTGTPSDTRAMNCAVGNISVGSVAYSTSAGTAYGSKIALTNAPTVIPSNVVITAYGATTPVSYSFYLGISIPTTGPSGACSGFLDVIAT